MGLKCQKTWLYYIAHHGQSILNKKSGTYYEQDPHTLADIYHRTATFEQNILISYAETRYDTKISNISFKSPIKELLNLVMNASVAVS